MLKIEIEEYDESNNKYPDIVGYYHCNIYYNEKLIEQGQLDDVLKINELNAIISCLDKTINGDMFDE